MKKCSKGRALRCMVVAMAIALFGFSNVEAQVSVNAPSGLSKRSNSAAKKKPSSPAHEAAAAPAKAPATKRASRGIAVSKSGSVTGMTIVGQYSGYRVQVLFTSAKNGRAIAQQRAKKIALKYPQYRAYMSYVAPRWRLRFGDFKTYGEARSLARLIKRSFPAMRSDVVVVTDKVNKFK
ncbi:MAG: SPOR domain-containing protein [Sodaliphilus sp.]|nr:SPOR domain-containing protein [Sodaliphilus sp.]